MYYVYVYMQIFQTLSVDKSSVVNINTVCQVKFDS